MNPSVQICQYKVASLKQFNETLHIAHLLPADAEQVLQYQAGQYLEFLFDDDAALPFSIANKPGQTGELEIHIRCKPGAELPARLLAMLQSDELIRLRGSYGSTILSEDAQKPLLFVATGTGFSQIGALIEQALEQNPSRAIRFYFGAEVPADLYAEEKALAWSTRYQEFCYIPVVSDALPEHQWQGRSGWVQDIIAKDFTDLSQYESYLCGQPEMVIEMVKLLEQKGASRDAIHADALAWLKI